MKASRFEKITGLLLNNGVREAGSANINGKMVSWQNSYQINILPLGNRKGQSRKYTVMDSVSEDIDRELSNVNWGALVSLSFTDGKVSAVEVISDFLESVVIE